MPPTMRKRYARNVSTESQATTSSSIAPSSKNSDFESIEIPISKRSRRTRSRNIVPEEEERDATRHNGSGHGNLDEDSGTEPDDNYVEIDHAMENDDDDELEHVNNREKDFSSDEEDIADQIELMGDQSEAFGTESAADSVIKSALSEKYWGYSVIYWIIDVIASSQKMMLQHHFSDVVPSFFSRYDFTASLKMIVYHHFLAFWSSSLMFVML